jgi:hypothetical protein
MVELEADTAPGQRVYQVLAIRESDGSEEKRSRRVSLTGQSYQGTHWQGFDGVLPSRSYRYKAKAESGTSPDADSAWSEAVRVATPAEPTAPPAPPAALTALPNGPFQIELRWLDRSDNEYGFEVAKRTPEGYVRVALVNPNMTSFVIHGRPPQSESTYRVRSFNPRGVSTPTNEAKATTGALTDSAEGTNRSLGPCTTRAGAIQDVLSKDGESEGPSRTPRIETLGGVLGLELIADPALCGNANCAWEIYGSYRGCYRRLGDAFGVGHKLVAETPSNLPVMIDIGHMSARDSSVTILQFTEGRFVAVDSYSHCEGPGEDLLALSPPFESCQEDDDLWWPPATSRDQ